jgi:hypothetical protein
MKKRPPAHLIDDAGIKLLKDNLAPEWVPREYKPDYGVDFDVELFDYDSTGELVTLGEHFFVQLKTTNAASVISRSVSPRYNVEKFPVSEDRTKTKEISVAKF